MNDIMHTPLTKPPDTVIAAVTRAANRSPCRKSRRGAVVFSTQPNGTVQVHGTGYNGLPDARCDGSLACRKTCGARCQHAEQRALREAVTVPGDRSDWHIVHIKTVDQIPVASGEPSCFLCSGEILDAGLGHVWLFHSDGWRCYPADDFHARSVAHHGMVDLPTNGRRTGIELYDDLIAARRRAAGTHELSYYRAVLADIETEVAVRHRDARIGAQIQHWDLIPEIAPNVPDPEVLARMPNGARVRSAASGIKPVDSADWFYFYEFDNRDSTWYHVGAAGRWPVKVLSSATAITDESALLSEQTLTCGAPVLMGDVRCKILVVFDERGHVNFKER